MQTRYTGNKELDLLQKKLDKQSQVEKQQEWQIELNKNPHEAGWGLPCVPVNKENRKTQAKFACVLAVLRRTPILSAQCMVLRAGLARIAYAMSGAVRPPPVAGRLLAVSSG